jgi:hypothetical protein
MAAIYSLAFVKSLTDINISILYIIHRPVFDLKHISEGTYYFHVYLEHTQVCPREGNVLCLRSGSETEWRLRNVVFYMRLDDG